MFAASLIAIVGPTLALLYLGFVSFQRQREGVSALLQVTRRLQAERLAAALEERVGNLVSAALQDQRLVIALRRLDWTSPEDLRTARGALDGVCLAHPTCEDLVVVADADLGLPRLDEPLPRSPDALFGHAGRSESRVARYLAEAASLEHAGQVTAAHAGYVAASTSSDEPRLRALALAGLARVEARGDAMAALATWARLARDHPDAYDLAHRPYAVIAAMEVSRLAGDARAELAPSLRTLITSIRHDFSAGRWPVSPGQAEYFATRLGLPGDGALQADAPGQPNRRFAQFAVARAVRRHLAVGRLPEKGQVLPLSGAEAGGARQLFVSTLTDDTGRPLVLAMSVDEHVVRTRIWPEVARLGDAMMPVPSLVPAREATPFRAGFRFWTIEWPLDAGRQTGWGTDVVVFGGTTVGVLAVLVLGVVLLVRDVGRDAATARLQAELVSGVSHDLKTPLSVIRLYAESLVDDLAEVDEARASHSRVILHESERLDHLVERVLEFSRHETGPPDYRRDRLDPSALVRGVMTRYGGYLSHLGFMATVDCTPGTPDVEGDSVALTQALVNLVENVVKYSGDARVLVLRVRPRNTEVLIEVEDRGIGIPQDEQGRLFEAFRRGSRTAGRGGYGLGLYLVARILEAHGGGVEVEMPPEGGTCVRLVLPAAAPVEG